jgi:hypothetical protein
MDILRNFARRMIMAQPNELAAESAVARSDFDHRLMIGRHPEAGSGRLIVRRARDDRGG